MKLIGYDMIGQVPPPTPPRGKFDLWLILGLLAYGSVNFTGIMLAARGVIHPPWNLITFFILIGPPGFLLTVGAIDKWCQSRAFSWWALLVAVGAMGLAVYVNIQMLFLASAAV